MDPFLEGPEWEDFHNRFNVAIADALSPPVESRYVVRTERRVYIEHLLDDDTPGPTQARQIDAAILFSGGDSEGGVGTLTDPATTVEPVECLLPTTEEHRETYVVVRERESMEVVTVIETLSPGNKRRGSDGHREYLAKRQSILDTPAHLVELDLLRRGARLPMSTSLPAGDYFVIVSRAPRRPRAQVYAWPLLHPLPTINVPLRKPDPDVPLDLQVAFSAVYDRARYDLTLDYDERASDCLTESECQWLRDRLAARSP
jgi:hypothetical protein